MIYFSGRNITPIIVLLVLVTACSFFFIKHWNTPSHERIIGYSIDVMMTPDNKIRYDTVGVVVRSGDSIFVRGTGAYDFMRKDGVSCHRKK